MSIKVDEAQLEENGRLAGIAIGTYALRSMERWRQNLTDYDCVMIITAVFAISAERLLRSGVPAGSRRLDQEIDRALLRKVNISSIAHATGLNRETARRKVNDLVEQGLLTRHEDGSIGIRLGLAQDDRICDQVRAQVTEIAAVANQLIKIGVLSEG